MQITRAGRTPSVAGSPDYFTGSVRIDAPFRTEAPARVGGATVTFEPGAHRLAHPSARADADRPERPRPLPA